MTNPSLLRVSVNVDESEVRVQVHDARGDSVSLFANLTDSQRQQLAQDAWSIGLRALSNAHRAAEEARLKDVGKALIDDVDKQLRAHIESQQLTMATVLGKFFDAKDGTVTQRLKDFVDDHGVLARLLDKYLAPQNSVLAQSLAHQVGETSPLFKKLSPTDSEGVVKQIEAQLKILLESEHSELARALDPLAEGGAVARFLTALQTKLEGDKEDKEKQLATALKELDANNEQSLLNQLVRESKRASHTLLEAMNADVPQSPMALLKASLTSQLQVYFDSQSSLAKEQQERQAKFENELREALTRMETKKLADQNAPRGGVEFEEAVINFLTSELTGMPCVVDETGATKGAVGRSKKGDAVVRFTEESAFAGARVVFEAKHDSSYTMQNALDEMDDARKNRQAVSGVFVMARSHANERFPAFARYGSTVLVQWDHEDEGTDAYLRAAIFLGLALVQRTKTLGDAGDIKALSDVGDRVESEISRLDKMDKSCETIRKNVDSISDEIRKGKNALDLLLRKAREALKALHVDVFDEAAERQTPIALPAGVIAPRGLPSGEGK